MAQSRLIETARRMRTIAETLNNPADRAVATGYANDLAGLARIEVPEPRAIPLNGNDDGATRAIITSILKRAYEAPVSPLAEDLLLELG
jgi:hypothetical protein